MARASKEAKAASRVRIVDAAARLFRESGIEATGVADVMEAAGLTHGGFYRHFASKEDLTAAAIGKSFEDLVSSLEAEIARLGAQQAVMRYVDQYLSEKHVSMRGKGCPLAALGEEAGRGPEVCKEAVARGTQRVVGLLAQGLNGDQGTARTMATGLLATLVGTLVMARSTASKSAREKILAGGRLIVKRQVVR